jgi:hypothetical protein
VADTPATEPSNVPIPPAERVTGSCEVTRRRGAKTLPSRARQRGVPHGGFAIGLERFVARLTGAANVRQVTAFPRDLHRITP